MKHTSPKIILIDQDGVLADYQSTLHKILVREHPDKTWLPLHQLAHHDTEKNYPKEYGDIIEEITLRKGFYRSFLPIKGGREALEHMQALGHDVRICTAPKRKYQNCVLEKLEWIEEHLGSTWAEQTIITRDKTLVTGNILIDDKPNITGACAPTWKQIFYDQPYNRAHSKPRLNWLNYKEVLEL